MSAEPARVPAPTTVLGLVALAGYALHGTWNVVRGHPEDLLWACHVAAAAIGVGLLARSASCVAVGVLWLFVGNVIWAIDLATGGELEPTSLATHAVGLLLGLVGLARLGLPPRSWARALVALGVLLAATRAATPARSNVNLVFAVWAGWEQTFPSHGLYLAMLVAIAGVSFVTVERVLRRLGVGAPPARTAW